jgi:hypothetical protein
LRVTTHLTAGFAAAVAEVPRSQSQANYNVIFNATQLFKNKKRGIWTERSAVGNRLLYDFVYFL